MITRDIPPVLCTAPFEGGFGLCFAWGGERGYIILAIFLAAVLRGMFVCVIWVFCMCPHKRIFSYNPELRKLARALRKSSTLGEVLLWQAIKGGALGVEFHRQFPVDEYILDFFCPERLLAIEIDGSHHDHREAVEMDLTRQARLEELGIRFVRFSEAEVRDNLRGVVERVGVWLEGNA